MSISGTIRVRSLDLIGGRGRRRGCAVGGVTARHRWPAVVVIAIVTAVLSAGPAWAIPSYNGCKFPGASPTIQYKYYSVESQQQTAHGAGASAWNASSADGSFALTTGTDPEIKVYDGEYSFSGVAQTVGGCPSGGGQNWTNDIVTISYDISKMSGYSSTGRRLIATHELGHAYGLAHAVWLGCGIGTANWSVMTPQSVEVYSDCGNSSAPYPNDVSYVNALY